MLHQGVISAVIAASCYRVCGPWRLGYSGGSQARARSSAGGRRWMSAGAKPCERNPLIDTSPESAAEGLRRAALFDPSASPPTAEDLVCIQERQLAHKVDAFCVGQRCSHGFPQAFGYTPVQKFNTGIFRLSCPLLVQAIDKMERDGGIDEVNARLATDFELRADFRAVNAAHGAIRLERTGADLPRLLKELKARFGGSAEAADGVLGSGITGIRAEAVGDAKCLHAHVADRLCRGPGSNAIGDLVLERLAADSIDVLGSDR
ncbi:unnamed protein product [Phaeothamnion confervicola]